MKFFVAITFLWILAGCSKDERGSNDKELPVVNIHSPTSNQQFSNGETVAITGSVTDNEKLAELHVHISNRQTGALLIDIHRYPAASSYTLSESFQVQAGIQYRVLVIAIDNSANEGRAAVDISAN